MNKFWYSYAIPPHATTLQQASRDIMSGMNPIAAQYCVGDDLEQVSDLAGFFDAVAGRISSETRLVLTWRVWWFSLNFWRRIIQQARLDVPLITSLAERAGFTVITSGIPVSGFLGGIFRLIPGLRAFYPYRFIVLLAKKQHQEHSVSVIVPCKNERGTIAASVERLPIFGSSQEIIFVDGHSTDGTQQELTRVAEKYPERAIRILVQTGRGKKNAVLEGIDAARGEIVILLDSDCAIAPEEMPLFYTALARGDGELINGARFIYPMEPEATPRLNFIANLLFPRLISWIMGQRITDSLCGTKVFFKKDYNALAQAPAVWGTDPFGDFTFLFTWGRAWKKIVDVPVHHHARSYGETRIKRFRAGWILLYIVIRAAVSWVRVDKSA